MIHLFIDVFLCSTVRIRFPFKETKVVTDIGDSVVLACSAQGFPLNIIWTKKQAESTAVIKRKTIYATINLGPALTMRFQKLPFLLSAKTHRSIRGHTISTVRTKTFKNDRIARCDVSWTLCTWYKHTCLRYFRSSLSFWCVFDRSHWNDVYAFPSWSTFKSVFKSMRFRWKRSAY